MGKMKKLFEQEEFERLYLNNDYSDEEFDELYEIYREHVNKGQGKTLDTKVVYPPVQRLSMLKKIISTLKKL